MTSENCKKSGIPFQISPSTPSMIIQTPPSKKTKKMVQLTQETRNLIRRVYTRILNQAYGASVAKKVLALWLCVGKSCCNGDGVVCHCYELLSDITKLISTPLLKELVEEALAFLALLFTEAVDFRFSLFYPEEFDSLFFVTTRNVIHRRNFSVCLFLVDKEHTKNEIGLLLENIVEEHCGDLSPSPYRAAVLLNLNVPEVAFGGSKQKPEELLMRSTSTAMADPKPKPKVPKIFDDSRPDENERSLFLYFIREFSISEAELDTYITERIGAQSFRHIEMTDINAKVVLHSPIEVTILMEGMVDEACDTTRNRSIFWMRRHPDYECKQLIDSFISLLINNSSYLTEITDT